MNEFMKWENDVLTVGELLKFSAEKYGEKPCIKYRGENEVITRSYRQMYENSVSVSGYINYLMGKRANIAIIGKTDYEYISSLNGIFMSGNVAVPLDNSMNTEKLCDVLDFADIEFLFYDDTVSERIDCILSACPKITYSVNMSEKKLFNDVYEKFTPGSEYENLLHSDVDPDECAAIIFTSGTTGIFKGAMLSSRGIISNVYYKEMSFEGDHVTLNVLPMHHIFCFSCDYLKNIKDGVTICLNIEMSRFFENILLFEPTVVRLVPIIIDGLVRRIKIQQKKNPSLTKREAGERVFGRRLRNIIASGACLSPGLAHEFDEMGITIRQGYGMTETGPRISVPDGNTCCESGGRVISTCEVRTVNGEIQVRSPSIMIGYYKNTEETEKVFTEDGWFKTGDLGYLTEDRELFITGRIKNLIILSNGENVSPEEIEKKFADEALIKEIIVYGDNDMIKADIFPDYDYAEKNGVKDIEKAVEEVIKRINSSDSSTREISVYNIRKEPLKRTSTGKIIR